MRMIRIRRGYQDIFGQGSDEEAVSSSGEKTYCLVYSLTVLADQRTDLDTTMKLSGGKKVEAAQDNAMMTGLRSFQVLTPRPSLAPTNRAMRASVRFRATVAGVDAHCDTDRPESLKEDFVVVAV